MGLDGDLVDDALLVVGELVGNAVLHGRPLAGDRIEVSWRPSRDGVEIAVVDGGGDTVPAHREADPLATRGRGLRIVAALADDWGVRAGEESAAVWARVRAHETTHR